MAKTTNCAFCGKEIKKGLFSSEQYVLGVGEFENLDCCEECYNKYKAREKVLFKRFGPKLSNYKRAHGIKKLPQAQVAKLYTDYVASDEENRQKYKDEKLNKFCGFFAYDILGHFTVSEFANGYLGEDVLAINMVSSLERSETETDGVFTKDDITKIEYAPIRSTFLGLFNKAYSYSIRLNDESVMQYRPCITRSAVLGHGFFFGYSRSAEKKLIRELEEFKKAIGSDLPIVKVKKM